MKSISNDLYLIIKQLDQDNKHSFISSIRKHNHFLILFNFLDNLSNFSEQHYLDFLKKSKIKNAAVIKSNLKDKLIDFLAFEANQGLDIEVLRLYTKASSLKNLGCFQDANKYYLKALDIAKNIQNNEYEYMIVTELSLVALAVEKSCMSKYIEYSNRGREIAVLRAEMMTFHNFYMRCASLFMECKIANSEKHILLVNQLKADSIFRTNETFLRYQHLIYLYGGRVFIHLMLGDLEEVCKDQEKQYNSWLTVEKEMSQVHPEESLTLMSDYLYYLVIAKKQKEYEEKVIELTPKMLAIKSNRLAKVELVKLIYLINTNLDSNDILEYIDFIENYIISEFAQKNEPSIHIKEFEYYLGIAYLLLKKFDLAVAKFEGVLNIKDASQQKNYDISARCLILMSGINEYFLSLPKYETENKMHLQNLASSFNDYLRKQRFNAPLEKMIIELAQKTVSSVSKKESKMLLQKAIIKIEHFLKDAPPFYRIQQAECNIIDVLNSINS